MNLPPIILASTSPRRSELLREMGLEFVVSPAHFEEAEHPHLSPVELAKLNACRKARVIAQRYPKALVLGADTVVSLGTKFYGKPADRADAARMLSELQGQTHQVVTGICLIHLHGRRHRLFAETTHVTFRALTLAQIQDYLARIHALDKAGAYAIQEHGDRIVKGIVGSFNNVVGLPTERLAQELAQMAEHLG